MPLAMLSRWLCDELFNYDMTDKEHERGTQRVVAIYTAVMNRYGRTFLGATSPLYPPNSIDFLQPSLIGQVCLGRLRAQRFHCTAVGSLVPDVDVLRTASCSMLS